MFELFFFRFLVDIFDLVSLFLLIEFFVFFSFFVFIVVKLIDFFLIFDVDLSLFCGLNRIFF